MPAARDGGITPRSDGGELTERHAREGCEQKMIIARRCIADKVLA